MSRNVILLRWIDFKDAFKKSFDGGYLKETRNRIKSSKTIKNCKILTVILVYRPDVTEIDRLGLKKICTWLCFKSVELFGHQNNGAHWAFAGLNF